MVDKEVILPFLLLQNAVELDQHSRVDKSAQLVPRVSASDKVV